MLYQFDNQEATTEATLKNVQIGLNDLEHSLGELSQMCEGAGEQYDVDGKMLAGLLRVLQCVAHVQRVNVDYLVIEQYKRKVKTA